MAILTDDVAVGNDGVAVMGGPAIDDVAVTVYQAPPLGAAVEVSEVLMRLLPAARGLKSIWKVLRAHAVDARRVLGSTYISRVIRSPSITRADEVGLSAPSVVDTGRLQQ